MPRLDMRFTGAHPDAPELPDDLDVLYRFVADEFEIRLDGGLLYSEVEFPIVQLAHDLTRWVGDGHVAGRGISFAPSGTSETAFTIEPLGAGWLVGAPERAGIALTDSELLGAARRFIDKVTAAGALAGIDVSGTLRRLAQHEQHDR